MASNKYNIDEDGWALADKVFYGGLGYGAFCLPTDFFKVIIAIIFPPLGEVINIVEDSVSDSFPWITWDSLKKLCVDCKNQLEDHVVVLCANIDGKAFIALGISDSVVASKKIDAAKLIKEQVAGLIQGGGGGQATIATAGGQNISNLSKVIETIKSLL